MKSYIRRNKGYFILLSACCASSALFAVAVQFLKGEVLDLALTGALSRTGISVLFLLSAILLEVLLFYGYDCASSRFIASCARNLRFDLMHGVLAQTYPAFLAEGKSACLAKFTNDAELVRSLYFSVLPQFAEILSKILLVSGALFLLSWRMALLTLFLLTTPLYVPKLIEKRLKRAVEEGVYMDQYDYIIVNDDLDVCVKELDALMQSTHHAVKFNKEFVAAIKDDLKTL